MIVALVPVSGDSIRETVPFLTRRASPSSTDATDDVVGSTVSETVIPSFCARRSKVSQVGLCSPISQRHRRLFDPEEFGQRRLAHVMLHAVLDEGQGDGPRQCRMLPLLPELRVFQFFGEDIFPPPGGSLLHWCLPCFRLPGIQALHGVRDRAVESARIDLRLRPDRGDDDDRPNPPIESTPGTPSPHAGVTRGGAERPGRCCCAGNLIDPRGPSASRSRGRGQAVPLTARTDARRQPPGARSRPLAL
jgi:hypothetical protein